MRSRIPSLPWSVSLPEISLVLGGVNGCGSRVGVMVVRECRVFYAQRQGCARGASYIPPAVTHPSPRAFLRQWGWSELTRMHVLQEQWGDGDSEVHHDLTQHVTAATIAVSSLCLLMCACVLRLGARQQGALASQLPCANRSSEFPPDFFFPVLKIFKFCVQTHFQYADMTCICIQPSRLNLTATAHSFSLFDLHLPQVDFREFVCRFFRTLHLFFYLVLLKKIPKSRPAAAAGQPKRDLRRCLGFRGPNPGDFACFCFLPTCGGRKWTITRLSTLLLPSHVYMMRHLRPPQIKKNYQTL